MSLNLDFIRKNEKIRNIDIFNMLNRRGDTVRNQYIIEIMCTDGKQIIEYKVFKSYNSYIACLKNGQPIWLGNNYNYSRTTSKYLNDFLNEFTCYENVKEVLKEYNLLENGTLIIKKGDENNAK